MMQFEWNSPEITPDDWYAGIVYVTGKGKMGVLKDTVGWYGGQWKDQTKHFSDWKNLIEKYNIIKWVYQRDLI